MLNYVRLSAIAKAFLDVLPKRSFVGAKFDTKSWIKIASRSFFSTPIMRHGDYEWHDAESEHQVVNITYVNRDGTETKIRGKIGDNVMYLAHRHEIDIEG